jgi:hypothetical protein
MIICYCADKLRFYPKDGVRILVINRYNLLFVAGKLRAQNNISSNLKQTVLPWDKETKACVLVLCPYSGKDQTRTAQFLLFPEQNSWHSARLETSAFLSFRELK